MRFGVGFIDEKAGLKIAKRIMKANPKTMELLGQKQAGEKN